MFISDRRSEKITQIQQNPNAEICWYFTKSREQFRLSGQLMLITHATVSNPLAKARTDLWQKLSDNAKRQFSWPQPKAEKANDEAFTSPVTSAKASSTEASSAEASREDTPNNSQTQQKPPKTFCLLCLSVSTVDHLALRGEPQDRYLYEKIADQNWQIRSVNP
ncbi:MAG: PPOX class probable FMN-dependent enzyme, alr4036 family [Phormidesmis priestleyi Ana]|uniref:PPOX class probable FMN-dependent enzyme, alr4036 family n=1 Tax=Phormidesmis priestleyi Ana TaxID=1666911 RepID=A0A0P7Z1P4_9CYAN|nr:MAG: PPOX class probable FMN-dependent enzyme, alr4036 family [Phormidesmis priestleyi Ana]